MTTDSQQLDAAMSAPGRGLDSLAYACTVIVVADLDRSSQWYKSVLGFTEHARVGIDGANVVLLEGAGTQLELIEGDGPTVSTEPSLCADPHIVCTEREQVPRLRCRGPSTGDRSAPRQGRTDHLARQAAGAGIRSTAIRDVEDNFIHIVQH